MLETRYGYSLIIERSLLQMMKACLPYFEDFSLYRLEITIEMNTEEDDNRVSWISQQNQPSQAGAVTGRDGQQPQSRSQNTGQHGAGQKPRPAQKMSKARAQALANEFKRWVAISSIVGFGAFSGLVALHQVGSTTTKAASASSQNSKSSVKKQGGNNFGTSTTPTATSTASKKSTATATPKASSATATPVSGTSTS